jgi:putative endonuclease
MERQFYVYILTSEPQGTWYIGYTSDLVRRVYEHRVGEIPGFTRKYGVKRLVYFETFEDPRLAQQRERSLKKWQRDWKINLIERDNPFWEDLYDGLNN